MKLKCAAKGRERRGAGTDGNLWGCEMRWREWSRKREEECSVTYRPTKKTKQKTQTQNPFIYFLFYMLNHRLQVQYNRDLQSMARWFIIETCCKCKGTFVQHFLLRSASTQGFVGLPEPCNALFTQFISISQSVLQSRHLGYCFLPRQLLIVADRHCLDSERCASP